MNPGSPYVQEHHNTATRCNPSNNSNKESPSPHLNKNAELPHHPVTKPNTSAISFNGLNWRASSIWIPSSAGLPPIDIMQSFTYERGDPFVKFPSRLKEIILPPDVYPPTWERRKETEDVIIRNAFQQCGTELIRCRADSQSKSDLICKFGRTFYSNTKKDKKDHHITNTNFSSIGRWRDICR
jgi:hypothetical protein